ncbi:MAG: DoxX family protein [Acidobacteria bacterium]|nr:DoxX family protein [Acidobacteriota bacterium]MDW7984798.1 DoxX family protein [Acidobacteriota bacterium]
MKWLTLIGRILYGGFFFYNGLNHFLSLNALTGYAQSKGVPAPQLAVIVSGLLILIGGVLILLGWKVRLGAWLIVLFLVPVNFMMHAFWVETDPGARTREMISFMKNIALLGAALMVMLPTSWPLALEKPTGSSPS